MSINSIWIHNGNLELKITDIDNQCIKPNYVNVVLGNFTSTYCTLTTLKNSPKQVYGNFHCSGNKLKSLKHGPEIVKKIYDCSNNRLTSLQYLPKDIINLYASFNHLKDFKYIGNKVENVFAKNNLIETLKYLPKYLNALDLTSNLLINLTGSKIDYIKSLTVSNNPLMSFKADIDHVKRLIIKNHCSNINSLRTGIRQIDLIDIKQFSVEKLFLSTGINNGYESYFTDLLNFCIETNQNIETINWPENFIKDNLRKNISKSNSFNL